jgi:hypothetical protein
MDLISVKEKVVGNFSITISHERASNELMEEKQRQTSWDVQKSMDKKFHVIETFLQNEFLEEDDKMSQIQENRNSKIFCGGGRPSRWIHE